VSTKRSRTDLKVAIVQDWLIGGGAERVLYEIHRMFPDAPIYTSYCTDEWRNKLDDKVVTGYLQKWPFSRLRKFLPVLRIWWFSRLNLSNYDLVISCSSSGEAKAARAKSGSIHINYCHAPTHYYWSRYETYLDQPGFGRLDPLARLGLRLLVSPLRRWDYKVMQKPNFIIANSTYTKDGIKKYYNRDSTVIFPPVDISRFEVNPQKRHGFVIAGRQTPYKRIDLAVEACTKLSLPLTVIGRGPDNARLRSLAGPTIEFLTSVPDVDMQKYFGSSEAFLFPGVDDFGVVAVEAQAAGTPLIAYKNGGALDYVTEGKTGLFFTEQSVESLCSALNEFSKYKFNYQLIRESTERFTPQIFSVELNEFIDKSLK
jgi:glycosyltransferase involved in cell wall biosynthesis